MLGTVVNNKEIEFHNPVLKQHTIVVVFCFFFEGEG